MNLILSLTHKISEKTIKCVSDYFNEYLKLEYYSHELTKLTQSIKKTKKTLTEKHPQTHEFIEQYYLDNQKNFILF